jgi:hypothetical protein
MDKDIKKVDYSYKIFTISGRSATWENDIIVGSLDEAKNWIKQYYNNNNILFTEKIEHGIKIYNVVGTNLPVGKSDVFIKETYVNINKEFIVEKNI